jgi:hypothetical protein
MIVEQIVEGMSGRGNRSSRRKTAPVPLSPPQMAHDMTQTRTVVAVVGIRSLSELRDGHRDTQNGMLSQAIDATN